MSLRELVIVTGMSGSGKGTVLNAFEDLGFFCIDNLPVPLISKFIEGFHASAGGVERAAIGIDIRAGERLRDFEKTLLDLRQYEFRLFILYLEAREDILVRRFSETRRPHPLTEDKPLREAIRLERKKLRKIRELADVTADTSELSSHQVKAFVTKRFCLHPGTGGLNVLVLSFGYKYGVPLEADLMFDVRFLPNPHFVADLRPLTGRHRKVIRYLRSFPETAELVHRIRGFLKYLVPCYIREGKSYLTIAVGCTGGRHRSVFIAEEIARLLKVRKAVIRVRHRDEGRGK
jgi:UPF0042 nucleotide-binding protein